MIARSRSAPALFAVVAVLAASPAAAQWTRVTEVADEPLFSVHVQGDTILASATTVVYVSTNAGATWKTSAPMPVDPFEVERARIRNGRIYAGTRRSGVFVSDDLGTTWSSFNQGLVGGFGNSQLDIIEMLIRGDSMFVATEGSGPWVRNLRAGTWGPFGSVFGPEQATNMTLIAAGGSRLLAGGGFNGELFFRDPGQPDWTPSLLFNDRLAAGLASLSAVFTGTRWVVGSNIGVFVSTQGQSPWTFVDPGTGRPLLAVPLALTGHTLFAAFSSGSAAIEVSRDDGSSWELLETVSATSGLAVLGSTLYASRLDGLWRRPIAGLLSVPTTSTPGLGFVIAGTQPVSGPVRFRFALPEAGRAIIEVFDVAGRQVGTPVDASFAAGPNEVAWDAQAVPSGVYHARLSVGARTETLRLVRVR